MNLGSLLIALSVTLVNPFIGSGGHGHVFVGADVPHGEICAGPMNTTLGWDWCSGYHDGDLTLAGFAQTRLSGTGVADYGDIVILPQICEDGDFSEWIQEGSQVCEPGYYETRLRESGIRVQVSATARCAVYRITYPEGKKAFLKIDLRRGAQSLTFRKAYTGGYLEAVGRNVIKGRRISSEWTFDQSIWFKAQTSLPVERIISIEDGVALLCFGENPGTLELKIAVSQQGEDGLDANLAEASRGFDKVLSQARKAWKKELSAIEFKGITPQADTIFYTALYHTAMAPQLVSDSGKRDEYTIFSLWDTYRAVHPLFDLTDSRAGDYCNSLLDIYDRTGRLPVWQLGDQDTDCMVGVHSIAVLCEAALKGVKGVDPQRVLNACRNMLSQPTYGMSLWDEYGYLPSDQVNWSVSVELEYCIDAKCIALLAESLGDAATAAEFDDRARRYARHFDPQTGFMRGVDSKGRFSEPFDPAYSLHEEADYVEGNAWQYSFLVPQDVPGLTALYGGPDGLEAKLDALFSADSALNEGASADITGMIGQYAHGNEPSHHIIYLYSLLGRGDKAADLLRRVYGEFYGTAPDGLIGNEDCGQMSAWYVFSALGFYPVFPADRKYVFGSPLCREAKVRLANGKTLKISAHGNGPDTPYIREVRFNGKKVTAPYITHGQIMCGGHLEYFMSMEK